MKIWGLCFRHATVETSNSVESLVFLPLFAASQPVWRGGLDASQTAVLQKRLESGSAAQECHAWVNWRQAVINAA